jgi:hypothetical protein
VLGPKESGSALSGMYGIAATELSIAVPPRKGE